MDLKLTVHRPGGVNASDVTLTCDATAQSGAIARAIAERDPQRAYKGDPSLLTIRVDGPGPARVLRHELPLSESGIRSGDSISLVPSSGRYADGSDGRRVAATLSVYSGPDSGKRFNLPIGNASIGRERTADVALSDPMVSKRHARLSVGDTLEIFDLGSVNGIEVDGLVTSRTVLRPGDLVSIGDTVLKVDHHQPAREGGDQGGVAFNRSPYLNPIYQGTKIEAPEVPQPAQHQPFPLLAMVAPLLMGVVMFAFTKSLISVIFMCLSPFMMIGNWISMKHSQRKAMAEATRLFHMQLDHLAARLDIDRAEEAGMRRREHVSVTEVVQGAAGRANLLWAMRPDRHGFLDLRVGLASLPTRSEVEMPNSKSALPDLYDELVAVVKARDHVSPVPVVAPLSTIGALGISGSRPDALGAARAVVAQVAGLHSPAEVALATLLPSDSEGEWDWIKWLPHTSTPQSPLECGLLAAGAVACNQLVSALHDLIDTRLGEKTGGGTDDAAYSGVAVVVLIEDAAPVDRPRLVGLAERGRRAGVYLIWVAETMNMLPAACEIFFTHDPASHTVATGFIEDGSTVVPVQGEPLARDAAATFARGMCPLHDSGAAADESSDVPMRVSFLSEAGLELVESPDPIIDRWRQSDSLPPDPTEMGKKRRRNHTLAAYIGGSAHGPLTLDLRSQGPHALVGGTTGAGKSEFLQSWVMGLATMHSPSRVTFLFVDYKGGAAFSECVKLPHTVGLVTDLTVHLVHRALRSLNAELRYREHILNAKKAKDVLELESRGDPECPPSLVIVVDEFAALVAEVPEFVDGVVNVAQRGRSLGLHLILATQRPAGVIKDNLRANTNLRVALRMADESDSDDVVGSKIAGGFDPSIPGRGVAKTGPGRLHLFQSAYIGGWTTAEPPPPPITIIDLALGASREWEVPEEVLAAAAAAKPADLEQGPNDLHRLVERTVEAAAKAAIPVPRKPWLPELAEVYDLAKTPQSRTDTELIFGVADDPDNQAQVPISFFPDADGNMSVIGTGGSGKSTFLRTLAVAAGLSTRGGPCQVYGLDFGSRGLSMLESLPHVGSVVTADDDERVMRLMRTLRETIDERAERYSTVRAGSIAEYRRIAGKPDEPRIFLLLDGMGAFRQAYELSATAGVIEALIAVASDGRQVGVHVVVSADRPSTIPSALASTIQRRLVLRLASDDDYAFASVPRGMLDESTPAGRGCLGEAEVQVAVLGGTADTAHQSKAMAKLADEMRRTVDRSPAPEVGRLPELVTTRDLPAPTPGRITVGLADVDLGPFALGFDNPVYVVGPPRSGKTTALVTIASQLRRAVPKANFVYLGDGRSALRTAVQWDEVADDDEQIAEMAKTLQERLEAASFPSGGLAVFFDGAHRLATLMCDQDLVKVVNLAGRAGQVVVADADVDQAGSSYALLKALRVARHGLALVPDQFDGDSVFKTPFPRTKRPDFPPGRALYVREGRVAKVQIAETEADGVAP